MKQDKTFLGTEPVGKLLFKLAVPTVIAQLVNMLYNIVDRIYIGHMPGDGSLALTGVGVCMPLIMIVSAFAALISSGGAPRASIAMGKGEHESAEKILGGCVTVHAGHYAGWRREAPPIDGGKGELRGALYAVWRVLGDVPLCGGGSSRFGGDAGRQAL